MFTGCFVFHSEQNKDMQVVMGSLSLDAHDPSAQVIEVENAIVHENYRETSAAVYNDIGKTALYFFHKEPFLSSNCV